MALLLFCITSIRAPTMPADGAEVGGPESTVSGTCKTHTNIVFSRHIWCSYLKIQTMKKKGQLWNVREYDGASGSV